MKYTFDVLEQILDTHNEFSQVEEKVAAYVLANPREVATQSITELAENSGVSVSTVSRFCRHLSLNGYQDFRMELVRSLTNSGDTNDSTRDITPEDSVPDMFSKMNTLYINSFNKTIAGLDVHAFARVCDMIVAAKDVHFVGTGNMLPIAMAAYLQFMEVSTKFHCELDASSQALATALMDEDTGSGSEPGLPEVQAEGTDNPLVEFVKTINALIKETREEAERTGSTDETPTEPTEEPDGEEKPTDEPTETPDEEQPTEEPEENPGEEQPTEPDDRPVVQ